MAAPASARDQAVSRIGRDAQSIAANGRLARRRRRWSTLAVSPDARTADRADPRLPSGADRRGDASSRCVLAVAIGVHRGVGPGRRVDCAGQPALGRLDERLARRRSGPARRALGQADRERRGQPPYGRNRRDRRRARGRADWPELLNGWRGGGRDHPRPGLRPALQLAAEVHRCVGAAVRGVVRRAWRAFVAFSRPGHRTAVVAGGGRCAASAAARTLPTCCRISTTMPAPACAACRTASGGPPRSGSRRSLLLTATGLLAFAPSGWSRGLRTVTFVAAAVILGYGWSAARRRAHERRSGRCSWWP